MYSPFLFPDTSPDFFPYSLYTVATSLISLPLMQSLTFIIKSSKSSLCYVFLLHSVQFILPISKDLYLVTTHHPTIPSLHPSQASSSLFLTVFISDHPGPHCFSSHLLFSSLFQTPIRQLPHNVAFNSFVYLEGNQIRDFWNFIPVSLSSCYLYSRRFIKKKVLNE